MTTPLVLSIESATSCVGCAIGTADGVIASTHSTRARRHAESLAPQIEFVLAQAGVHVTDIEMVAVDVGPGLYTGLRVGITTARAMAHMLGVPMLAVSSLEAIAHANRAGGAMTVTIDARRGEVFHAAFTISPGGSIDGTEPAVGSPSSVPSDGPTRVVGDGVLVHAEALSAAGLHIDADGVHVPSPDSILALATSRLERAVQPVEVQPLYLRRPDAVAKWDMA
ncbi:MAG: tRNA (adenosine(37)-N6)-threonylcarbamoyltransferase complex dimerization subunit type 1 TsaB [Acidimicrobiales bacterium]